MNPIYSPIMMLTSLSLLISTLMALSSTNWILLWGAMELNLLSFIPIMLHTKNNQETEGSVKYFLAQALGSALLLMSSMSMWMYSSFMPNLMPILLTTSVLLKLGSAPCHFWYPSVMASISWISCLILSTWQKITPLTILALLLPLKDTYFIMVMAGVNALVGGIMGMNQSQVRTIMAYSSIGHIGWMLSLTAIYKPYISILYFLIYSILITPLFLTMMHFNIYSVKHLNKIAAKNLMLHLAVIILLLSLGGLPPLTGFMPKLVTIVMLMESMQPMVFMLVAGSVMNLFFYLNIAINMMSSTYTLKPLKPVKNSIVSAIILATATVSLGMSPLIMM
uniref:NADH-ubiquinone oxidoreductase chain 2 n=1 Tax=Aporrectodea rosea TaxID=27389 RepID=A0A6G6D9H3_9ANNE|nr:NADH dehydrogenase subunit 2 [Aporrectodea rosea]QIE13197.1 NADH dehydrogenase subunit 2 [Aporrectodea rosea]